MAKRTEDEIHQKLAELEVAMKQEQSVKAAEVKAAEAAEAKIRQSSAAMDGVLIKIDQKENAVQAAKNEAAASSDLYNLGGFALLGVGLIMVMSHITPFITWGGFMGFGGGAATGVLLLPVLIGFGMLIYNYKSRVAQVVTAASLLGLIVSVIGSIRFAFSVPSLLDLVLLFLPICAGCALLAKGFDAKRQAKESTKLLK